MGRTTWSRGAVSVIVDPASLTVPLIASMCDLIGTPSSNGSEFGSRPSNGAIMICWGREVNAPYYLRSGPETAGALEWLQSVGNKLPESEGDGPVLQDTLDVEVERMSLGHWGSRSMWLSLPDATE